MRRFASVCVVILVGCEPGGEVAVSPVGADPLSDASTSLPQVAPNPPGHMPRDIDAQVRPLESPFAEAKDALVVDAGPADADGYDGAVTQAGCEAMACEPVRDIPYSCQAIERAGESGGLCWPDFRGMHFQTTRLVGLGATGAPTPGSAVVRDYLSRAVLTAGPPLVVFMSPRRGFVSAPAFPELYLVQAPQRLGAGRFRGLDGTTHAARLAAGWPDPEGFPRGPDLGDSVPVATIRGEPFEPGAFGEPIVLPLMLAAADPGGCPWFLGPLEQIVIDLGALASNPTNRLDLMWCMAQAAATPVTDGATLAEWMADSPLNCATRPDGALDGWRFGLTFALEPAEFLDDPTNHLLPTDTTNCGP